MLNFPRSPSYRCRGIRASSRPVHGPHEAQHRRLRVAASENIWQQIQHRRHSISARNILSSKLKPNIRKREERNSSKKHKSLETAIKTKQIKLIIFDWVFSAGIEHKMMKQEEKSIYLFIMMCYLKTRERKIFRNTFTYTKALITKTKQKKY